MAREYLIPFTKRSTFKAALLLTKKNAEACSNTNRALSLRQGEHEAKQLAGYCEQVIKRMETTKEVPDVELTSAEVQAARIALRRLKNTTEHKEDEFGNLFNEGNDFALTEVRSRVEIIDALLALFSAQTDAFIGGPSGDVEPATLQGDAAAQSDSTSSDSTSSDSEPYAPAADAPASDAPPREASAIETAHDAREVAVEQRKQSAKAPAAERAGKNFKVVPGEVKPAPKEVAAVKPVAAKSAKPAAPKTTKPAAKSAKPTTPTRKE